MSPFSIRKEKKNPELSGWTETSRLSFGPTIVQNIELGSVHSHLEPRPARDEPGKARTEPKSWLKCRTTPSIALASVDHEQHNRRIGRRVHMLLPLDRTWHCPFHLLLANHFHFCTGLYGMLQHVLVQIAVQKILLIFVFIYRKRFCACARVRAYVHACVTLVCLLV
jgi:hypothetical protein